MSALPKLQIEVANTVINEIIEGTFEYRKDWINEMIARLELHDPVFHSYVTHLSIPQRVIALIIYRLFETQIEVDVLEKQSSLE